MANWKYLRLGSAHWLFATIVRGNPRSPAVSSTLHRDTPVTQFLRGPAAFSCRRREQEGNVSTTCRAFGVFGSEACTWPLSVSHFGKRTMRTPPCPSMPYHVLLKPASSRFASHASTMKLYLLFVSFMASLGLSAALETTITSLELLFTRAFNAKIADGIWENIFGNIPDLIRQPFCAGGFVEWPIPAVEDGSDLANLLQLGTFYCAYNENARYVVSDGETETLLLETGTAANPYANGLIVDWWQELVDYVNTLQLGDVDLVVEWKLFPNSQASMDAVDSGEVHAACGNWAPDGVYTPLGWDERYSRAAFLSKQVCPSYLQNSWVWTPVELSIKTFGDLVDAIDGGKLSDFCVLGTRHGGFETSCQNSLDLFATGFVNCTGYNTAAFDVYEEGGCDAVWDGYPANFSEFKAIQQPFLYSPVTYFRQTAGPAEDPAQSDLTTLQLAFTHAFENKVADGTWADYFGDQRGMEATAFCTGQVEAWPLPDPMEGSDLKAVLDRGMFRW